MGRGKVAAKDLAQTTLKIGGSGRRKPLPEPVLAMNPVEDDSQVPLAASADAMAIAESVQKQKGKRSLKRNDTPHIVSRMVYDNFRDFSAMQVDGLKVGDQTLRQRLESDKRKQRHATDDKFAMGKKYFLSLRALYSQEAHLGKLKVKNNAEKVRADLANALKAARSTPAKTAALVDWLQSAGACNQRELVGLLRFSFEQKSWLGGRHQAVSVEILKFLTRTNAASSFPEEISVYRPQADKVLVQALATTKANQVALSSFWALYMPLSAMVLDPKLVDKLLEVKGSWRGFEKDLDEVVCSELGERMFGFAVFAVSSLKASTKIQSAIDDCFDGQFEVTEENMHQCREAVGKVAGGLEHRSRLDVPRVIEVSYRNFALKVETASLMEEASLRIAAKVKSWAVLPGPIGQPPALQELWCEHCLAEEDDDWREVNASVCVAWRVAREAANSMLDEEHRNNGSYIKSILEKKGSVMQEIDPTFKLEKALFLFMTGSGAVKALQKKVLSLLPSEVGKRSPQDCLVSLEALQGTPLYSFCDAEHQSSLSIVMELLQSIASSRLPTMAFCQGSNFKEMVGHRLAYYAYWESDAAAGSAQAIPKLGGREAMARRFEEMEKRIEAHSDSESISMDDLLPFHVFNWLLSDSQKDKHNKWVAKIFKSASGGGASVDGKTASRKRAAASSGSASQTAKKNKNDKGNDDMSLFT